MKLLKILKRGSFSMLNFYPSYNNVLKEFNKVAGTQTGILNSMVVPLVNYHGEPTLKSMTGTMPDYHKQILKGGQSIQYHIIGYGSHYEEAFIKYIGESIERYSTLVGGELVKDKLVYATYKDIIKKGKAMPVRYMNVFTQEQIVKIKEMRLILCDKQVTEDDVIAWIKCPSLIKPNEDIWVPAQMLFIGYENKPIRGEHRYIPAFSTGTASHKSLKKALLNALIEYIQIDAFMVNWYTKRKCKRVNIDDKRVLEIIKKHELDENCNYEIIPMQLTLPDLDLPSFAVYLRRKDKKAPYMLLGIQGDMDPIHGMVRGIMEAVPIAQSTFYNTIFHRETVKEVMSENARFTDLDKNVLFYAAPYKEKEKDNILNDLIDGEINLSDIHSYSEYDVDMQIQHLIKELANISEYAVYMDLTPPEAREKGWYVMRVLVPEILEMCIPDFPFANHPRMIKYGGVKNEYPHPMP